jgi:tRNA/rRNA methyltransferase
MVKPQLAENVGTAARAMYNCGVTDLRLVQPREDHLTEKAIAASTGAEKVLRNAQLYESTEDAIADLNIVFATTARPRDMVKPVYHPKLAATKVLELPDGGRAGFLFGREKAGLENDDVALADAIVEVPLNPDYCSLNLAQAVLLMCYEWYQAHLSPEMESLPIRNSLPANKDVLVNFFERLEADLIETGFLRLESKRPAMIRNIRNMFERAHLTEQEVSTLHGMIKSLQRPQK